MQINSMKWQEEEEEDPFHQAIVQSLDWQIFESRLISYT